YGTANARVTQLLIDYAVPYFDPSLFAFEGKEFEFLPRRKEWRNSVYSPVFEQMNKLPAYDPSVGTGIQPVIDFKRPIRWVTAVYSPVAQPDFEAVNPKFLIPITFGSSFIGSPGLVGKFQSTIVFGATFIGTGSLSGSFVSHIVFGASFIPSGSFAGEFTCQIKFGAEFTPAGSFNTPFSCQIKF